eukprot:gene15271-biopygen6887
MNCRQLVELVDMCLLRCVELHCRRVLPYGVRQLIKDFLIVALDNANIHEAVKLWYENRDKATERHGHISLWDTHRVTDLSGLFYGQRFFNEDISGWDESKVTTMRQMFTFATSFNQPLGTWNTASVRDMACAFALALDFNQPLASWDVSSVQNMAQMFYGTGAINQPLSTWDVYSVTTMDMMFGSTHSFNQPLASWNVAAVPAKRGVLRGAAAFRQIRTRAVWRAAGYTG